jgi:hypothetical protein
MVAQEHCKRCNLTITGSTAVNNLKIHGDLCSSCRGFPIGFDRISRKHEICEYCKKEVWQH